ncbi:hypothetical protein G7Y79_00028g062920 [Physcia stellaris]|nr:hypothetical protein G7Y79_00028g062920 [Physcia stellaris]
MNITQILSALDNQRPLPRPSATASNTATSQALSNELTDNEHERKVREAPNPSANAFAIVQTFETTQEEEAAATLLGMKESISSSASANSRVSYSKSWSATNSEVSVEEAAIALLSMKRTTSSSSSSIDNRVVSASNKSPARSPQESSSRISKPSSNPKIRRKVPCGRELNGLKDFLPLPRNADLGLKSERRGRKTWNK